MNTFSAEFERELLKNIEDHLKARLDLEKKNLDDWDLVSRATVCEKLDISSTTLENWEKLGLRRYQSPFEKTKKIYYRKTDILDFMAVDG